jgi:hypothetical protein
MVGQESERADQNKPRYPGRGSVTSLKFPIRVEIMNAPSDFDLTGAGPVLHDISLHTHLLLLSVYSCNYSARSRHPGIGPEHTLCAFAEVSYLLKSEYRPRSPSSAICRGRERSKSFPGAVDRRPCQVKPPTLVSYSGTMFRNYSFIGRIFGGLVGSTVRINATSGIRPTSTLRD